MIGEKGTEEVSNSFGVESVEACFDTLTKLYDTARGSMPSFFMRESKVVRLRPRRAAAPSVPPTRPRVSLRMRKSCSRSLESGSLATDLWAEPLPKSATGTSRAEPRVRITARSIRFSSSRIFPGQCQRVSFFILAAGTDSISFSMRRAYFWAKYRTSRGMSSGRSRSGGIWMGKTLSR